MKSTILKTTLREIRESLGRYMAILAIVALGVGFFTGLKVTKPAMLKAGGEYLEKNNLYDLRLLSTVGFDEQDVKELNSREGVEIAEGAVYVDFLAQDESGAETVLRAHSLLWVQNHVVVKEGRMPTAPDECVVDSLSFTRKDIGTTIRVSENNEEDTIDMFAGREYKIVGICDASYYINYERGSTALGNGKLKGYIYIPEDGFDTDTYTEVFIRLTDKFPLYSQEYKDYIDEAMDWAEPLCEDVAQARYERLKEDAEWQIADGERELEKRVSEADEKLADAKDELLDGEKEIEDAKKEIADGWQEIADARAEIGENQQKVTDSLSELEDGKAEIADGLELLEEKRIEASDMEDGDEKDAYETGLNLKEAQVQGKKAQVEAGLAQANMGSRQLEAAENKIAREEKKLEDAEKELEDAEKELADGWEEYEENRQKLADETADARKELEDAREKLADLKEPETYVLGRDKNIGYACFESDSDIVEGISNVFPVFFFLVAALVCITTMTRMVEEQRTQIGILKALGYSEGTIMGKYLFYSGSAAVLGCDIGFLLGSYIFPVVIWSAYRIMYRLGDIRIILDWKLGLISLIVSILCSMGTTIATCRYELTSVAAELMRPKAPKSGKRIILERIPFLWNRMKFLRKVSARNIFRYKQRFYMMVFGIGGCTALLLTGFGIKDSIKSITYNQFDEIQINDMSVVFNDPWYEMDNSDFEEIMAENAERYTLVFEESTDLTKGNKSKSLTLVIPEKAEDISFFLNLHTTHDVPIAFPGKGEVVLTEKLADKCGAGIGDMVTLQDDDMNTLELKVSGISENYVYNYAYISTETWTEQIGSAPEYKSAYINVKEEKDVHSVSAAVMNSDGVASVTVNADMKVRFSSMMKSLDYVVLLIIGCAGSLAFIVLYNLTNINITERLREIATIKVLGFYRRETASYVFRENLVLTGIGAGVGLIMGRYLHRFVMYNIDIDMIAFDVHIAPLSVLYSIVLTFVFAGIVDWAMNKKLDGINMAESMKSVE